MRLRIQCILYNTSVESIRTTFVCLAQAVEQAIRHGLIKSAEIAYGDCSGEPVLTNQLIASWRNQIENAEYVDFAYTYFGRNLGSARGHNSLMELAGAEHHPAGIHGPLLIMNPDVKLAPDALVHLLKTLQRPQVGLVEARQLPIEHPKAFDTSSGRTSWASTACALTSSEVFWEVGGFDADTFFLYCDDVDFSWMVREAGYDVVYQPAAVVFHDKRLKPDGSWPAGDAEIYYSAEAALLLTHKWSRGDLTEKILGFFEKQADPLHAKARDEFIKRKTENRLPAQRDSGHKIGIFDHFRYAKHRF